MIEQITGNLADYGIAGVFILFLIYNNINLKKNIVESQDQIKDSIRKLFEEQRQQDKDQQDKLIDLIKR
jgi:flagellar basal body-associated protein FliL